MTRAPNPILSASYIRAVSSIGLLMACVPVAPSPVQAQPAVPTSSASESASTAPRPPLAITGAPTSLSQIVASDPVMMSTSSGREHYARTAAQSLIERFGLVGVSYQDRTIRPDLPITTSEAAVLLKSGYDAIFALHGPLLANHLEINGLTGPFATTAQQQGGMYLRGQSLPRGTCTGDDTQSTPYADLPASNPATASILALRSVYGQAGLEASSRRFESGRLLKWGMAQACLPKLQSGAFSLFSHALRRDTRPDEVMTRGDFLVVLERELQNVTGNLYNFSLANIPGYQVRDATPQEISASKARLDIAQYSAPVRGRLIANSSSQRAQSASFVDSLGRIRLGDVGLESRVTEVGGNIAINARGPDFPSHNVRFLEARSLGATSAHIAMAVPRYGLENYQNILGKPARREQGVYQGWGRLGGQGRKPPFPVAVVHRQRTIPQSGGRPDLLVRSVSAFIETPSGLIIHTVESPQVPPDNTYFSFVVLELLATDVALGEPMIVRVAPVMRP
jgi:hypothetical protein